MRSWLEEGEKNEGEEGMKREEEELSVLLSLDYCAWIFLDSYLNLEGKCLENISDLMGLKNYIRNILDEMF